MSELITALGPVGVGLSALLVAVVLMCVIGFVRMFFWDEGKHASELSAARKESHI